MAENKKTPEEIDYGKKLKEMQIQFLDKLGSGNLNQNELIAMMNMMQKQEPNTFGEMMPMIMAMKMMNPTPKQDPATPMLMMYMMNSMKKDNGSELDRKIERLEEMVKEKEDKKMYDALIEEIKNLKNSQDKVGFKDILAVITNKDKVIDDIKQIADNKDRELLLQQFQSSVGSLQDEIKKLGSGGDIAKMRDTLKAVKDFYETSGFKEAGQKSKEEMVADMVNNIANTFAPAVNRYVETVTQRQQMSPHQMANLQRIQAQRPANPQPQSSATIQLTNPEESKPEPQQDSGMQIVGKDLVIPDLIDIADSSRRRNKML